MALISSIFLLTMALVAALRARVTVARTPFAYEMAIEVVDDDSDRDSEDKVNDDFLCHGMKLPI